MAKRGTNIPTRYLRQRVTVETRQGEGGLGVVYSPAREGVRALVNAQTRMVRRPDGEETVSSTTLVVHPDDIDAFKPGTRVVLPDGRRTVVITCAARLDVGIAGAWQHGEVTCE